MRLVIESYPLFKYFTIIGTLRPGNSSFGSDKQQGEATRDYRHWNRLFRQTRRYSYSPGRRMKIL